MGIINPIIYVKNGPEKELCATYMVVQNSFDPTIKPSKKLY